MRQVRVSELRQHLPHYLGQVAAGEEIQLTSRGRVIARLLPFEDPSSLARRKLAELRARARVGDVVSPIGEAWEAELDPA